VDQRPFKFISGRLCLDFANTVGWPSGNDSRQPLHEFERFTGFAPLVGWSHSAGLLTDEERDRFLQRAKDQPAEASAVLRRALRLRQAIHCIFVAVAAGYSIDTRDLTTLNMEFHRALTRLQIVEAPAGFDWGWKDEDSLERLLWPVARSAADLLASKELRRLRTCAGEPCGFLFLDTSPNGTRRWCIMRECGNRAKARRHYHRRQTAR